MRAVTVPWTGGRPAFGLDCQLYRVRRDLLRLAPLAIAGALLLSGWLLLWLIAPADGVIDPTAGQAIGTPTSWWGQTLTWLSVPGHSFNALPGMRQVPVGMALAVALAIVGLAYLGAILLLDRKLGAAAGAGALVVSFALVFQITLLLRPSVINPDVLFYLGYGQLGGVHGLNPYQSTFQVLAGEPLLELAIKASDQGFRSLPSPYGALWTLIGVSIAPQLYPLTLWEQVLAYRLLMNGAHIASLGLVWWLLGRTLGAHAGGRARLTAFTMFAWNPLLLLEVSGNAHNDGLMLTLLLVALVPLTGMIPRGNRPGAASLSWRTNLRWLASFVFISLSVLVKYATGVVGLIGAVVWLRELRGARARTAWLSLAALLAGALTAGLYARWFVGPDVLVTAFEEVTGRYIVHSIPGLIQDELSEYLLKATTLTPAAADQAARVWVGVSTQLVFLIYLGWELRRLWSRTDGSLIIRTISETSARVMLVLLLLVVTQLHSWYFSWPLTLVALLGWRHSLSRVVVGYSLTAMGIEYLALFDWYAAAPWAVRILLRVVAVMLPLVAVVLTGPRAVRRLIWAVTPARSLCSTVADRLAGAVESAS